MMEHWASEDWGWTEYRALGGTLEHTQYMDSIAALPSKEACGALLVSNDLTHDKHPLRPLMMRPAEASLARLCADFLPSAGEDAPLALLGSVSEYYQASNPAHRSLLRSTMAAHLFSCPSYKGKPVYRYWLRNKPRVDEAFKQAVGELARSPLGLWLVESIDEMGVHLRSLCGLGRMSCPDAPVNMDVFSAKVGDSVLGRVARVGDKWSLFHPVVLPSALSRDALQDVLQMLMVSTRIHYRDASLKDVLRWRGDVFHRWCVERAFADSLQLPRCGTL